jgi:hypothetical protein
MKKNPFLLGCLLLFAGLVQTTFSFYAQAQTIDFEELDKNQDGNISIKEAVANPGLLAEFGKIDRNGDGKINTKELNSSALLAVLDRNPSQ